METVESSQPKIPIAKLLMVKDVVSVILDFIIVLVCLNAKKSTLSVRRQIYRMAIV